MTEHAALISLHVRSPWPGSGKVILSPAMAHGQELTNLSSCWHSAIASSGSLSCACVSSTERGWIADSIAVKRFLRSPCRSEGGVAAGPAWLSCNHKLAIIPLSARRQRSHEPAPPYFIILDGCRVLSLTRAGRVNGARTQTDNRVRSAAASGDRISPDRIDV